MSRLVYLALIALSLIWGGSFYFIKMLLEDFGPWSIAFLRSFAGLLVIVIIMIVLKKPFGLRTIAWIPMTLMALINTAIPWALIGYSETRLPSSMASVLNATTPAWTIIVGVLFFKSISYGKQWLGIGIAMIGVVVLLDINPTTLISVDMLGFACMIGATFCYAIGSQLSKNLLSKGYSMYQVTFGTLLCTMIGSGTMAFTTEGVPFSELGSGTNMLMVLGLGVFGSGIAYILFYYMVEKGSPEFATMVTYLVPCTAVIWGYTLLNEHIKWTLLAGLIIILAGVFIASRKNKRKDLDQSSEESSIQNEIASVMK
ncbi:DMT family transporter [Paenibacillus crassostreae]|uniref:Multidrug transporter n=1 Tax=Paenibacillus crassostreae TaxID=1763538 RepID=A0A167B053_9BACL|nr:DMT family transporter [Paenibacillus crassostreae]AOZ93588.1 multidrug transporter [Paenibacillus crassostreae]OAB71620.1 multidrug transporter [Paenibacillus crassostreae]